MFTIINTLAGDVFNNKQYNRKELVKMAEKKKGTGRENIKIFMAQYDSMSGKVDLLSRVSVGKSSKKSN